MTPIICAEELTKMLKKELTYFTPSSDKVSTNGITYKTGFMPIPKNNTEKEKNFPYIAVRPFHIEDYGPEADDESTANLYILVGTYNEDKDNGHYELYNMMEMIRQAILQHPVIGGNFELKYPLKSDIPESQGFPTWFGYIEARYSIPNTTEEVNIDE